MKFGKTGRGVNLVMRRTIQSKFFLQCLLICVFSAACLLFLQPARGHHSFTAEFTAEKTAELTGVVTQVWFRNPHVRYYLEIHTDDGDLEQWDTRGSSPSLLTRRGWTKDRIRIGDTITIKGHRAHEHGRKLLSIIWVELADGTRLE